MARINFRQGIVRHGKTPNQSFFLQQNGNDVDLLISPELTTITFIDGDKDYLFTESVSISNAWLNLTIPSQDYWLYWDLDRITGVRTFGSTTFAPIYSATPPTIPVVNQMWFDLSTGNSTSSRMHYWNGSAWIHVLRVIASKVNNFQFFSPIDGFSVEANYIGTQIGATGNVVSNVGSLAYDKNGKPILNQDGRFFTTEDVFTTGVPDGASIKVNNTLTQAQVVEPVGAYQVVVFDDFEKVSLASTFLTIDRIYGLVDVSATTDQIVNVITKGSIFNEAWDFSSTGATPPMEGSINSPIYVTSVGELTTDIGFAIPGQIPVGAIIGRQTILFSPGIYGTINVPAATSHSNLSELEADDHLQYHNDIRGDIRYYEQTVADSIFATIVHTHVRSDITDFAHNHLEADIADLDKYAQSEVDAFVNNLDGTKVNISGSTMTGPLTLPADPSTPLHAATKQYVDAIASGIDAKESVAVGTTVDVGGTYNPVGGSAGTGGFIGVNITALDGAYLTDYDFTVTNRVLIKDQTDAKQNGIYIVTDFTTPISSDLERAPDHDGTPIFEVSPGNFVFISEGDSLAGSGWLILGGTSTGPNGTILLNTDDINWSQVASSTAYKAGNNIDIDTGNNISVIDAFDGGTVDALKWNTNSIVLTLPATGQPLIYNATTPAWENALFSLPTTVGTGDQVLVTDGVGGTSWTDVQVTNPMTSNLDVAGFALSNSAGSFILPVDNGTNGYLLSTDGAGVTSWIAAPTSGLENPLTADLNTNGYNLITTPSYGTTDNVGILVGDSTGADGGNITLSAGDNSYGTGTGGSISITAGSQTYDAYGYGGNVNITSGNTSYTGSYARGSHVQLTAGDGYYGGYINLIHGAGGDGAYYSGAIKITNSNPTEGARIRIFGNAGYGSEISLPDGMEQNTQFILPGDGGAAGNVLTTDGAGNTTWEPAATGGSQTPWTSNIDTAGFNTFTQDVTGATPGIGVKIGTGTNEISLSPATATTNNIHLKAGDSNGAVVLGVSYGKGGNIVLEPGFNTVASGYEVYGAPNLHGMVEIRGIDNYPTQSPGVIGTADSHSSDDATDLQIRGGAYRGGTGFGRGGEIGIYAGEGEGQGPGGALNISAGSAVYGYGGWLRLNAGSSNTNAATSSSNRGGTVVIDAGDTNKGPAGDILIRAGNNPTGSTSTSRGGYVKIQAGDSTNGTYNQGGYGTSSVYIQAGNNSGTNAEGGHVKLIPGAGNGGGDGAIEIHGSNFTGEATLHLIDEDSTGNPKVVFKAPTLAADTLFELPVDNGSSGNALLTDGSGVTSWGTPAANNWLHANGGDNFAVAPVASGIYNPIALGNGATAGRESISIGSSAGTNSYSIAIGRNSTTGSGSSQVAIGSGASTGAGGASTAVGSGASSLGLASVSIGQNASSSRNVSVAIGRSAIAGQASDVAIGAYANTSNALTGGFNTVIGRSASAPTDSTYRNVVMGASSTAVLNDQIVIGYSIDATDVAVDVDYSVKLGSSNVSNKNLLHLHSKGKLELYGNEAQFVFPNYITTVIPATTVEGGAVWDSTTKELKIYDGTSFSAIGGASVLDDLTDVTITTPSTSQVLTYNGANWINQTPAATGSAKPGYEKINITGSPVSDIVNTTVATVATSGSPLEASLQVFRNGLMQEEDLDGASPIVGDFIVSGANQLTFAPGKLLNGDTIIIYVFN